MMQPNMKQNNQQNPYLVQKIMSASSNQLIAYLYDAGAMACLKKDRELAVRIVGSLISSLNFEYKESAVIFFNVYSHLRHLVMKGKFEEAREMFLDMRKTWAKAFKVS